MTESDRPVEPFDLERVRQNWDRAAEAERPPLPERVARVAEPVDPYPEAQRVLARITRMARSQFQRQEKSLAPFLAEAADLLARMQAASAPGGSAQAAPAGEAPAKEKEDIAALRQDLQKVLNDLEDLFEVHAGIGLP